MSSTMLGAALALAVAAPAAAGGQNQAIRFQDMDVNGDGRITRAEWRGSDQAFDQHDWNGDGVLSGDEIRPGAQRNDPNGRGATGAPAAGSEDWTDRAFRELDRNGDGRLTTDEWSYDRDAFRRADHNNDGIVTRAEFLGEDRPGDDGRAAVDRTAPDRDDAAQAARFDALDTNRDNRVSRSEWRDSRAAFDRLDENRDGVLTRAELIGEYAPDRFGSLDTDGNGVITRGEWLDSAAAFTRLDANRDGRISRDEWSGYATAASPAGSNATGSTPARPGATAPTANRSRAWRAGYDRGMAEGRAAGREDHDRNQGWDLEGQRELEQADSGYESGIGARTEYQDGYRTGFRAGYPAGFGPH